MRLNLAVLWKLESGPQVFVFSRVYIFNCLQRGHGHGETL